MAENLFGRVPVGGITPSKFDPDFSDILAEEQLQLDRDIFERQKFTQDRTIRLNAAEDVAGFDLSKIHNHFAIDFKHQTDAFQKNFNSGEMTPEQITAESLRLSSLYNEYAGFYGAQREFVKGAIDDPNALIALNASLPAGSTYYTDKTLAQMDATAGLLWEEGSYDPQTNKATYVLDDGVKQQMTLEEALRYQSMHGSIGSINNIGPYMFGKIDDGVGNLNEIAQTHKQEIALKGDGENWDEETAGMVFDHHFDTDKEFRGALRDYMQKKLKLNLTDEEKIAFDNYRFDDINFLQSDSLFPVLDRVAFDSLRNKAKQAYIEFSKFTKPEEKADATDKKRDQEKADLSKQQESYFQTITAEQEAVTLQGDTEETNQTTAINVPVPAGQEVTIPLQGEGDVKVSAIKIDPISGNVYVTASTDYEAVINKQISNVQITHILNEINEYYQLSGDDAFGNIDDIIERANAGEFGFIDSEGRMQQPPLTMDEIIEGLSDGVSGTESVNGSEFN